MEMGTEEERHEQSDLSPAVHELKKLHTNLLEESKIQLVGKSDPLGVKKVLSTVVSIIPGDRRKEDGWYKVRSWQSKTDSILHQLDKQHKEELYHEVFIAGEALSRAPRDIVFLMMHQVAHQAAGLQSTQSYHSDWMTVWLNRLFLINKEALARDDIFGWGHSIDFTQLQKKGREVFDRQVALLAPENLDLYRAVSKVSSTTGKMLLWYCDCPKAPRLRTGAIPRITCDVCKGKVKYRGPDGKMDHIVWSSLKKAGYIA
jgi:hypothetical protein